MSGPVADRLFHVPQFIRQLLHLRILRIFRDQKPDMIRIDGAAAQTFRIIAVQDLTYFCSV